MKNILSKIKRSNYFLLFIFLFGYFQSIQIRVLVRREFDWYIFTPEAAVASFLNACILFSIIYFFIRRWQKSDVFSFKEALKIFGASLLVFFIIMKAFGLLLALAFGTFERNFNQESLIYTSIATFMDAFIYGSFFLAYFYHQVNRKYQEKILQFTKALSESKISQLKTQLNPHFLFNNLNVLDQFIEEDKHKASSFLNEFADIYRYVLQVTDKKLVSIEEELAFARSYFSMMQHKYLNAYQLEIQQSETSRGQIIPLTLQLLLENAIGHNLGMESKPVVIKIEIGENIVVSNNFIRKKSLKATSGRALLNLEEQYNLLSNQKIKVHQSKEEFSVTLPVIQQQ